MIESFFLALGLSMDTFAVSISIGNYAKKSLTIALKTALLFAAFQIFMPFLGFYFGEKFKVLIADFDHWVAFGILAALGAKMLKNYWSKHEEKIQAVSNFTLFLLAIATSIDALAAGLTLSIIEVNIIYQLTIIGLVTFILSLLGVTLGSRFRKTLSKEANFVGGIILILIGLKILLSHLFS